MTLTLEWWQWVVVAWVLILLGMMLGYWAGFRIGGYHGWVRGMKFGRDEWYKMEWAKSNVGTDEPAAGQASNPYCDDPSCPMYGQPHGHMKPADDTQPHITLDSLYVQMSGRANRPTRESRIEAGKGPCPGTVNHVHEWLDTTSVVDIRNGQRVEICALCSALKINDPA